MTNLEAFTAAYMEACRGRAADHNMVGFYYAKSLWDAAIEHEREACANIAVSWSDKSFEAEQIAAEIHARAAAAMAG